MDKRNLTNLFLIVFLAAALRIGYITYAPPSLNWDEVSHGYNAFSILKTGADEWGQKIPLINFRAYGDYPTPLNLYLTIPFISVMGLNDLAIRMPHAILGILTIIAIYFFVFGLTRRKNLALLAAFLASISPWYLFTSRFVLQSNLSVFLLTSSMAFFFNRDYKKYFINVSFLLLFLTLFSYHTTRIFSPVLLLGMILNYKSEILKKWLFLIFFFVISLVILLNPNARARSGVLSILGQGAVNKIESQRNASTLPYIVTKIIYNRPIYFGAQFIKNYISYFSPEFLFLKGGSQYQFSVPDRGLMYLINLPFFYLGLFVLIKKAISERDFRFILFWVLLYPIPASLTNEKFAVLRATTFLPIPELLTALGFYSFLDRFVKQKALLLTLFCIVSLISLDGYLENYFVNYRNNYSWSWQYGYKDVTNFVQNNYDSYDKIIITKKYGEPHEFILFYTAWSPAKYIEDTNLNRFYQSGWYWVDGFDKFYFVNDWDIAKYSDKFILESKKNVTCQKGVEKCLLITSPGNKPAKWRKIKTINFLDGKPAFEMYSNILK